MAWCITFAALGGQVGKRVRASKKRLTFKFCFLGGEQHAIQLVHSVMSGKKVVIADGMTLLEVKEVCQEHTVCVPLCVRVAQAPSLPPPLCLPESGW